MSGQSAHLSLKEACAMQNRTQVSGTQGAGSGGTMSGPSKRGPAGHKTSTAGTKKMAREE